jgi:hypothetical protein
VSQVETVALWVGLLVGVASIVLSVVAIAFAEAVNRRSREVSDQTIKSLQKIESSVERLAADTRELIKVGWDRMLGSMDRDHPLPPDTGLKEVAAGLAAELRTELGLSGDKTDKPGKQVVASDDQARVKQLLSALEDSVAAQLNLLRPRDRPSDKVDAAREELGKLSLEAQALAHAILGQHLTREQYIRLRRSPIADAVRALRHAGLLVPVAHSEDGVEQPAYYFPPGFGDALHLAGPLLPHIPSDVERRVRDELRKVGYENSYQK